MAIEAVSDIVKDGVSAFSSGSGGAPLDSPAFTGTPTAPTATVGTNTTQIATTAFVKSLLTGTITVTIDGGGAALTTGAKGDFQMPFGCTLTGWTLLSDQIGSVVVEISKSNYATWPTVSAITASAKPTITSERKGSSTTLTGWITAIAANDVLQIGINSAATIQRVTLMLNYTRT